MLAMKNARATHFAHANNHHFNHTTLDIPSEISMWFDSINEYNTICFVSILIDPGLQRLDRFVELTLITAGR